MNIAWFLNVLGLVLTTVAAVLMYYYPPRNITQYTNEGEAQVQWVATATPQGRAKASRQARLSRAAPFLLAAGFVLQLVAALLPVCFPNAG